MRKCGSHNGLCKEMDLLASFRRAMAGIGIGDNGIGFRSD